MSCGSQLKRVLRRSLSLIDGSSARLTELSSFRVAQAWWVAAAAVRCHISPSAAQLQSRLAHLVSVRLRTTLSRGGVSAMERALSLSALLEAACATPAKAPQLDATRLAQRAIAVTNPYGGAGYRSGQVDPVRDRERQPHPQLRRSRLWCEAAFVSALRCGMKSGGGMLIRRRARRRT